jgi:hypothetical protein
VEFVEINFWGKYKSPESRQNLARKIRPPEKILHLFCKTSEGVFRDIIAGNL